jgi:hypothetical protein
LGAEATTPVPAQPTADGPGQDDLREHIVGNTAGGARDLGAEYAPGLIGLYLVYFEVPLDTETGPARPFALAVGPHPNLTFGNGSAIPIQ